MSLNFADVVVLGNDLSGLVAGSLLAKRGLGVLILEESPTPMVAPSLLPPRILRGLGSPSFRSFLGVVGIPEGKFQRRSKEEPIFQVVMPKARIDVFPDRSLLTDELTRLWPNDRIALTEFLEGAQGARTKLERARVWDLFPLNSPKDEKTARAIWNEMPELARLEAAFDRLSPPVRTFFHALLQTLAPVQLAIPTLSQAIFFFSEEGLQAQRVQAREGQLKKWLAERLEYFGGSVRPYRTLEELKFARRNTTSLRISGFQAETKFRYMLSNMDVGSLAPHLPRSFWYRSFRRRLQRLVPSHCLCTTLFRMPADYLPVGLAPSILWIEDPAKPLVGLNYLQLTPLAESEENKTEGGLTQIVVSYRLPLTDLNRTPAWFDALHETLKKRLESLFPFSEGVIESVFPKEEPSGTGELFDEEPRNFASFKNLARRELIYGDDVPPKDGLQLLGNTTPYHNLYLTGPQILGHLGTEGKVLSGLRAADLIWAKEKTSRVE